MADDRYDEGACSVIDSLEQIGSQWRLIVLHDLQGSTGASARTLSRVLDDLQETGFVDRRLEEDAPVATYYSLTPKGGSLAPVFDEIACWADEWLGGDAGADADEGVESLAVEESTPQTG